MTWMLRKITLPIRSDSGARPINKTQNCQSHSILTSEHSLLVWELDQKTHVRLLWIRLEPPKSLDCSLFRQKHTDKLTSTDEWNLPFPDPLSSAEWELENKKNKTKLKYVVTNMLFIVLSSVINQLYNATFAGAIGCFAIVWTWSKNSDNVF